MNPGPRRARFLQLLVSLTALLLLYPFLESARHTAYIFNVLLTLTLLSSLYSLSDKPRRLRVSVPLVVLGVVGIWTGGLIHDSVFQASPVSTTLFLGYVVYRILKFVLTTREVTSETIYGALCAYLLLGLIWALFFYAFESVQPGSLQVRNDEPLMAQCVYFSYVTLTTLGYGDLTPLSPPVRSLAFVEALSGQLYLAVLIARLVGLHIAGASRDGD